MDAERATMGDVAPGRAKPGLRRALGLPILLFYGLGVIVGAGIYVAVGRVAAEAGMAAPLAFVIAGVVAALTGFVYAEFASRHPEAGGAAVYVHQAFGSPFLARAVGASVWLAAVVAAASIARGSAAYLTILLPLPDAVAAAAVVLALTALAAWGVVESASVAAAITLVEIGGLLVVIAAGAPELTRLPEIGHELWPASSGAWLGTLAGAFVAFFAFLGFETIVNMAEETKDAERTLPKALLLAIAVSGLLYAAVALVAVVALPIERLAGTPAALCGVLDARGWGCGVPFATVALLATLNGVLIEIIVSARLAYGMAARGWLPPALARVGARTRTPLVATAASGAAVLVFTLVLDFSALVSLTSALTLVVFAVVNFGLWRLKRREPRPALAMRVPGWLPLVAALACLGLLAAALAEAF